MLSLHTNAAALSTQNAMGNTNKALSTAMTRLGTGFRVNSAMDDAAGLQIATRLDAQARGMGVAQKNTQNGISMLQTAEGSMNEVGNMLLRMKDLATEAANGTANTDDRAALQAEFDALGSEISNILKNTSFAGSKLFSDANGSIGTANALKADGTIGAAAGISFQVGATSAETIQFTPGGTDSSLSKLMTALGSISVKIGDASTAQEFAADAPAALTPEETTLAAATAGAGWVAGNGFADQAAMDTAINAAKARETLIADYATAEDNLEIVNAKWADGGVTVGATTYANEADLTAAQATANTALTTFTTANTAYSLQTVSNDGVEISTGADAQALIDTLSTAINAVGTFRSDMGAVANRLEHTFNNLGNMITNTNTAKGRIMDTDFASESSNMTKNQMLMQVSTAMLKQSNSLSQMVGSLVQ